MKNNIQRRKPEGYAQGEIIGGYGGYGTIDFGII
jgi:hypothetical protein